MGVFTRTLLLPVLALLCSTALGAQASAQSGPIVRRTDPVIYDFSYQVQMWECQGAGNGRASREFSKGVVAGQINMPIVVEGPFHQIDESTVRMQVWAGVGQESQAPLQRVDKQLFGASLVAATIGETLTPVLRWKLHYRVQAYNVVVDEQAAQRIAWPRNWPAEVADGLEEQWGIESKAQIFQAAVDQASGGRLKEVTPYLAAKELVRHALMNIREERAVLECQCSKTSNLKQSFSSAVSITGAANSAHRGRGMEADVVAVCVATLRAAGIPARLVIGAKDDQKEDDRYTPESGSRLIAWGEFYLPEAGWIPFDTEQIRSVGFQNRPVTQPWPGFGGVKDMNKRFPVTYEFIAATSVKPDLRRTLSTPRNRFPTPVFVGGFGHNLQGYVPMWENPQVHLHINNRGRGLPGDRGN